jgi:type 1 fimbria pilin
MKFKLILSILIVVVLSSCTLEVSTTLESGTDQVNLEGTYEPNGCTLNVGNDTYDMDITENTVDTTKLGTYKVTYAYTLDETTYTCERVVFVRDLEGPSITLNQGIDTLSVTDTWVDASVTLTDNVSSEDNITLVVQGEVLNEVGTYLITYQAIDEAGNSSFKTRYVTVSD